MNYYGITAIRWNDEHTEVETCMVHELERQGRSYVVQDGKPMWYTDVAALINDSGRVLVMERNTDGEYEAGEMVQVRTGNEEHLESTPENTLFELPRF